MNNHTIKHTQSIKGRLSEINLFRIIQKIIMRIKGIPYIIHYYACKNEPMDNIMTKEEAKKNIEESGYKVKPLWIDLPSLRDNYCDVSLIIPVYNSHNYLPKCLDSVLNQKTKYKYEVICVDDGSTDNSLEILKVYKERYPQILNVVSQKNTGIAGARNKGITHAKGEYIGFIDNDDTISIDFVEKVMDRAYRKNVDIVQTAYKRVSANGVILSVINKGDLLIESSDYNGILNHTQGYVWGGVFKKSLFEKIRFPDGYWYEDMITFVLARLANRIAHIGEPLYYYLVRNDSASNTLWNQSKIQSIDELVLAIKLYEYSIKELMLPKDIVAYEMLLVQFSGMLWARTNNLPIILRKSVFAIASDYLRGLCYKEYKVSKFLLSQSNKCLINGDFMSWDIIGRLCYNIR